MRCFYDGISYGEVSSKLEGSYLVETLGAEYRTEKGYSDGFLGGYVDGMKSVIESKNSSI